MVTRIAVLAGLGTIASLAQAQVVPLTPQASLEVGYGWSASFSNRSGDSVHIEGPTLGLTIPIVGFGGFDTAIEPSALFGGRATFGSSAPGDVYRILATVKHSLGQTAYAKLGAGYATTVARESQFSGDTGAIALLGVGSSIPGLWPRLSPKIELDVFTGGSAQQRGVFIGVVGTL